MSADNCDKGPVLEQITTRLGELHEISTRMADAVVEIAKQGERMIGLADKTEQNHNDIQNLFTLFRDHETKFHISPASPVNNSLATKAANWNMLQVAVVTAAVLGLGKLGWDFVTLVLGQLDKLAGG